MNVSRPRRAPSRRSFLRYLSDNNPFYLLSAASMLLACLLLSNTTTWSPIALHKLIGLIVTLSGYELLLVGLGVYLIARRGRPRDGVMLLVLEAVFLVDTGFLYSEVYQESLRVGLVVNAVLLVVAALKLAVIFRTLRMPLRSAAFGLTLAGLVLLLGHPAILKSISDQHSGRLPDGVLYAMWWGVSLFATGYALAARWATPPVRGTRADGAGRRFGHVLLALLLISLVAHLGTSHWVYACPFQAADLSPVLLGLTVLLAGVPATAFVRRNDLTVLCGLLPLAAVFTSLNPTWSLRTSFAGVAVSPLMLAAAGAYLAWVYAFALRNFLRFTALGLAAALVYVLGPTWETTVQWADRTFTGLLLSARRMVPQSQGAWGTLALIGAFVLLAIGAVVSLWHPQDPNDTPAAAPPSGPMPMADSIWTDAAPPETLAPPAPGGGAFE